MKRDTVEQINIEEAARLLRRCREEIVSLRRHIDFLAPKAEAYDAMVKILAIMPGKSQGMSEDLVWRIDEWLSTIEPDAEQASSAG